MKETALSWGGSNRSREFLSCARTSSSIPIRSTKQSILGGDALLLIAGLLEIVQLSEFIGIADELGITSLVEVHDPGQLEKALRAGAQVIGINNRNLRTFETDLKTTLDLLPSIPQGVIAVSESGIRSRLDVELLMRGGVHAFLVGEALMSSADVPKKIRELAGT